MLVGLRLEQERSPWPRILSVRWRTHSLHGVQHFDSQEIEMCPAKHVPLQKFEAVDMTLRRAITPLAICKRREQRHHRDVSR